MKNNTFLLFTLSIILILLDQITKIVVKGFNLLGFNHHGLNYGERLEFIGEFVQFTFVENPGMAFSIEFGEGKIFLSIFSIIASILLALYITKIKEKPKGYILSVVLIFAGATGNMIDRVFYGLFYDYGPIFYGKVVDFILVDIPNVEIFGKYYDYFPVFNVADSCVSIGIVLLLFYNQHIPTLAELRNKEESKNQND